MDKNSLFFKKKEEEKNLNYLLSKNGHFSLSLPFNDN